MVWFGIVMWKTVIIPLMIEETYMHIRGNIKTLEISSVYHVQSTLNTSYNLNDTK